MLVLLTTLAGCDAVDSMKEGLAHSQAVSDRLEKSLGLEFFVGFNWENGSLTSVTVSFQGLPENIALAEISEAVKSAVAAEFKQQPKEIVIIFRVEP